jgi:hypothetical protein
MKLFIIKLMIFSTIVVLLFLTIALRYTPPVDMENEFFAAMIDKHHRLNSIKGPRLIVIGGSNVAFGIDSRKLTDSLQLSTVNMALNAALGATFIFNEVIPSLRKDDVVMACIEYPLFNAADEPNPDLIYFVQNIFPEARQYYPSWTLQQFMSVTYYRFKNSFHLGSTPIDKIYNRKSLNEFGDIVAHLEAPEQDHHYTDKMTVIPSVAIETFQSMESACRLAGAKFYLTFPSYPQSLFEANKKIISDIEGKVRRDLNFVPILGRPETIVFPDSDFFDTPYHLNKAGREKRTQVLIKLLKSALGH